MKMIRKLRALSRAIPVAGPRFDAPIRPSMPFFAIGDIHGQFASLSRALSQIQNSAHDTTIVCVGDYIDRGEQSHDVLRCLSEMTGGRNSKLVCLMGNHEQMCLRFIDDPENSGDRWFRNGGLQTLASFGVELGRDRNKASIRDRLADAMGEDLIAWLRNLPSYWITGNIAVIHAGADPSRPIGNQPSKNLLWGHPAFATTPRTDGMWVVHGHTIVDQPKVQSGRISIDTGAYATGRLTVARVSKDSASFMTA